MQANRSAAVALIAAAASDQLVEAIANTGVDSFGSTILHGGKVDDASFNYDSVPIPQGSIAAKAC